MALEKFTTIDAQELAALRETAHEVERLRERLASERQRADASDKAAQQESARAYVAKKRLREAQAAVRAVVHLPKASGDIVSVAAEAVAAVRPEAEVHGKPRAIVVLYGGETLVIAASHAQVLRQLGWPLPEPGCELRRREREEAAMEAHGERESA